MRPSAHAFSNPLAGASWGLTNVGKGGIFQQLRFTFANGGLDDQDFIFTVKVAQEMAAQYSTDPEVIQLTRRLFNGRLPGYGPLKGHDELGEISHIVRYFQGTNTLNTPKHDLNRGMLFGDQGSYRYQKDPYGTEFFQSPAKVIRDIQAGESGADCDDVAMACAAALVAAGYPAMLMIVDADAGAPGQFNHVLIATKTFQPNEMYGDNWFPVELIHDFPLGKSVKVSQYIPLRVDDYDLSNKDTKLIPTAFR